MGVDLGRAAAAWAWAAAGQWADSNHRHHGWASHVNSHATASGQQRRDAGAALPGQQLRVLFAATAGLCLADLENKKEK